MAQTHPDRLASVATLFGMAPARVTSCRVLELGCSNAGNLIPMAHYLPGSHFTGVDLEEGAIAEGRAAARELGLRNLELIAMDLGDIGPAMGEFDYIIAHGVYSWVPDAIRDRMLAVCRERLAEQGVAFISYNALPGRRVPMMLREMMLYHTRDIADAEERIAKARELLRMVQEAQSLSRVRMPLVDEEIGQMLMIDPGCFLHDDLAPVNDAFYVRDFVAQAARHRLQYLGDADVHAMFGAGHLLDWTGNDVIEREQYRDFLTLRRFRQTLLCRAEVALERSPVAEQMDRFLFSSPARQVESPLAAELRDAYPLPVAFEKLLGCVEDREQLRETLFGWVRSGFATLHVHDFATGLKVSARPRSSRLARWESARTGVVTYSTHTVLKLDDTVRTLLELLDGTRAFDEIMSALALAEDLPVHQIRERLPKILSKMAATGLLEE
jgi:hypothetical protein